MCPENTCALVEVAEEALEVISREEKEKVQCTPEKKLLGNRRPSRKFERLYKIGEVIFCNPVIITDHLRLIAQS